MMWALIAIFVVYVGALVAALLVGSNDVQVAMIAVGGTAVGAIAATVGSVSGARAQASAAQDAAELQARAAYESVLQEQRFSWAGLAYNELNSLLSVSRKLGTSVKGYESYDDVVTELQVINTHANLLVANPIIGIDEGLAGRIRSYVTAIGSGLWDDWQTKENPSYRPLREKGWVPPGELGDELAQLVGRRIHATTTAAGLHPDGLN